MPHAILKGRGMPLNPRCPRCNREIETIHHAKIACGGTEHILIVALRTTTPPYGVFCLNILLLLQSFQQETGLDSWYRSLDIVETEKRIGLDGSLPSQLKYCSTGARFYQRVAACKEEPHTQLPHADGGSFPLVSANP